MEQMMNQFCWNELATADVKKAKDFYKKVFGWEFKDHSSPEYTYTIIGVNGKDFGGIWEIPKDEQKNIPPHWMGYILVADVKTSTQQAKQNGANVIKDVTQAGEMGLFSIIQDPTGAHVALWQTLRKD